LSDALKDFVRESRILHGASQYYATEQRRYDRSFPAFTFSGEHVLKSLQGAQPASLNAT